MADAGEESTAGEGGEPDESPRTKLLREVAAQTDAIEHDLGPDFGILAAVSVVLIQRPDGNVGFRVRPIDISPLEAIGVLEVAKGYLQQQVLGTEG